MTTEEFLIQSQRIHEGKYIYPNPIFRTKRDKIEIICKEEHHFFQSIYHHLDRKQGCPRCSGRHILSQGEFIDRVFKNCPTLDFSNTIYTNTKTNVIVNCPTHGVFQIKAGDLLNRSVIGCRKCYYDSLRMSSDEFLTEIKLINPFNHGLEKVEFIDYHTHIIFTCSKHGDFLKTPQSVINQKCIKCADCTRKVRLQDEFIKEIRLIHGNRYDYSKSVYVSQATKLVVTCLKHGDFLTSPYNHLIGRGCPDCANSKGEDAIIQFLTKNNIGFIKQATFPGCRSKALLRFDFYLPAHNTCIEFDGYWHFNPFKGDMKRFSSVKKRDRIKNIYCRENHIPLIRISGLKNIELTLTKLLLT